MMAENTKINISKKPRQSMDNPFNFNAENTSVQREDSISEDCTRHKCENVNENQRQDRFRAACDMETSEDMSLGRNNSFSSICSLDSGYASRKNTLNSIIYMSEDEQTK